MIKARSWVLAAGLIFYAHLSCALPLDYEARSASEKQQYLWEQCQQTSYSEAELPSWSGGGWSSLIGNLSSIFSLSSTFDLKSDEFSTGRRKIIHTHGSVAKIRWVASKDHPFTGIYQQGGIGLARFSLAGDPTKISFTPGMAIKILLNGDEPSRNIFAMNSLEGQGSDYNFFSQRFSNEISRPTSWVLRLGEFIFNRVKSPANQLSCSHFASINPDGSEVDVALYPEQLYFIPSKAAQKLYANHMEADLRKSFAYLSEGLTLYTVEGVYRGELYQLGSIVLDSQAIASSYGDYKLFFQHPR